LRSGPPCCIVHHGINYGGILNTMVGTGGTPAGEASWNEKDIDAFQVSFLITNHGHTGSVMTLKNPLKVPVAMRSWKY